MIYIDPPYGVKFGSNFQPFVRRRDVSHNDDDDLTREPEMVKAYRDTWELGLHSYLTYMRDRLLLCCCEGNWDDIITRSVTIVTDMVTSRPSDPALVLFGSTRRRLLGWLFGHPDEAFYLRELLRKTGAPEGAAQRELAALTAAGLLTRTVNGRQVYFQANRASPIFMEVSSLLTKTTGLATVLRDALLPLADRIRLALIYGSAARNELRPGSDIDLLVVGDVDFGEIVKATRGAEERLGREVNPSVYPPEEFRTKLRDGHHFLTAVLREPYLLLIGDPDDLERVGASEQMARRTRHVETGDRGDPGGRRPPSARQRRRRPQR